MPRKGEPMSEELKAKLAAGRAAKKQTPPQTQTTTEPTAPPAEPTVTITQAQLDKFIALLENTKVNQNATPTQKLEAVAELEGVKVDANGMQGTMYKYPVEEDYYPNPVERIYSMPELSRFAPRENYEIKWTVEGSFYENERTHVYYAEPKFTVTIYRIMFNDDGSVSNRRAIVGNHIQHEDEVVAKMLAREMGLPAATSRELMDEARFQRIRRWILDLLVPAYRQSDRSENIGEMVVDGKVVPFIEVETNADKAVNPNLDMNKLNN